jgi:hypothetical protein
LPLTRVGNNVEQFGDSFAPDRRNDAKFGKVSPNRIYHRGLLANKQMPCAVKHEAALLLRRLGGHKPHVRPGVTASQMASASGSFFWRLTYGLT